MPLRAPEAAPRESRLLGEAPAFLEALDAVSAAAPLAKPVLLVGERGTGKEGFAERLHFLSSRWDGPFEKLNCAAISETLLESGALRPRGRGLHRGQQSPHGAL